MEVEVTTGAVRHAKLQSNRHHQQTNTQLFTGRMPFLSPNKQCQSTEEKTPLSREVHKNMSKSGSGTNAPLFTYTPIVGGHGVGANKYLILWLRKWALSVFLSITLCIGGNEDCWKRLPNEARKAENRGRSRYGPCIVFLEEE